MTIDAPAGQRSAKKSFRYQQLADFASVTLADILANGAAILILLIVLTVAIKNAQEADRLEQVEEVSVLLSRDLVSSVVMNALPSSPPAILHDYHTSPLDRNPAHSQMPIIEFHAQYLREYYSGQIFSRNELLLQENAFDRYLSTLSEIQRRAIRIDIYGIRLFYVGMSILKDHGIDPRHWHFIGYPKGQGGGQGAPGLAKEHSQQLGTQDPDATESQDQFSQQQEQSSEPSILFDAELDFAHPTWPGYPSDQPDAFYPYGQEQNPSQQPNPSQQSGPPGITTRFRSAVPYTNETPTQSAEQTLQELPLLLNALFIYMANNQQEADNGYAAQLDSYSIEKHLQPLMQAIRQQGGMSPDNTQFFNHLTAEILNTPFATRLPIPVLGAPSKAPPELSLALPINQRIQSVRLIGNQGHELDLDLDEPAHLSLHFSLFPSVYQGIRTAIEQDSMMLLAQTDHPLYQLNTPDSHQQTSSTAQMHEGFFKSVAETSHTPLSGDTTQPADYDFRWRVVTLIDAASTDFLTAFVYAGLDPNTQELLLAVEENAIALNGIRLQTERPVTAFRLELWWLLLYALPTLLLAWVILRPPTLWVKYMRPKITVN